jgi:hypothetical protein
MELMQAEQCLCDASPTWQQRYEKHYQSVQTAMEDLVKRDGAIETEGQQTFEDGMISCCALQLAQFALLQEDIQERLKYQTTAEKMLTQHNCLTQLLVPDARMRGGTLRFWETQYDIKLKQNMIVSPHGWSAWRIYATWYMFVLTRDQNYYQQTLNALGSGCNLIDTRTGQLRYAFVVDPSVQGRQWIPNKYPIIHVGEDYLPLSGDWNGSDPSDNDVFEMFKALDEIIEGNEN